MANYPGSIVNFPTLTDGLSPYLAEHQNQRADEIEAIETYLGLNPHLPAATVKERLDRVLGEGQNVETQTLSGNLALTDANKCIQKLVLDAARDVTLPVNATANHWYLLVNESASAYTATIKLPDTTILATLEQGKALLVVPIGSGVWRVILSGGRGKYSAFARCSVSSGVPNPTSDLLAQTAIYIMPWNGNTYPQWNGLDFMPQIFAQQTLTLNAAHLLNSLYDIYLWMDGATQRVVSGPAWSSATTRGTGAGTAEVEVVSGVMVNKVSMTVRNGGSTYTMPARYGTVVGTFVPSANGQVEWSAKYRGICNLYNQMPAALHVCPGYVDNNAITTYAINSTTWVEANGGTDSRIKFVLCAPQAAEVRATASMAPAATGYGFVGIGIDTIINAESQNHTPLGVLTGLFLAANNKGVPLSIGSHYASLLFCYLTAGPLTINADGSRAQGGAADPERTHLNATLMM